MAGVSPMDRETDVPPGRLEALLGAVRACRICRDQPSGKPLPHEPRPVLRLSASARILIAGQAPGVRVHESGVPFTDPSGVRLRAWLGMSEAEFYDTERVAIVPMGFCFPGQDARGADRPPRPECADAWRARLLAARPGFAVTVLLGQHAVRWHLGDAARPSLTETVSAWRDYAPAVFALPHPSWRNNAWLNRNPWFAAELLPALRAGIRRTLA